MKRKTIIVCGILYLMILITYLITNVKLVPYEEPKVSRSGTYEVIRVIDEREYKLIAEYKEEVLEIEYTCYAKEISSDKYYEVVLNSDKCSSSQEMHDELKWKIQNGDKQ